VLRRRSDRWRSALVELQALAVVAAAVLGVLLGMSVYQQGRAHVLQQEQRLHSVQARVVGEPYSGGTGSGEVANVSWTGVDGRTRQETATVPFGTSRGDRVAVWFDAAGKAAAAPASPQETVSTAVLTGGLSAIGVSLVVVLLGAYARIRLDRHDEEAWEAEWQVYEPLWARRR
jgi:hypothetical protein